MAFLSGKTSSAIICPFLLEDTWAWHLKITLGKYSFIHRTIISLSRKTHINKVLSNMRLQDILFSSLPQLLTDFNMLPHKFYLHSNVPLSKIAILLATTFPRMLQAILNIDATSPNRPCLLVTLSLMCNLLCAFVKQTSIWFRNDQNMCTSHYFKQPSDVFIKASWLMHTIFK